MMCSMGQLSSTCVADAASGEIRAIALEIQGTLPPDNDLVTPVYVHMFASAR